MTRPVLLDAFCGAGGCTRGYQMAGFDVVGVDINPQRNYVGDGFVQVDALEYVARHGREFDAIHASPTCQTRSRVTDWRGDRDSHSDLLAPMLRLLRDGFTETPWVVENVWEAVTDRTLRPDYKLCGSQFGLPFRRHRAFETNWPGYELLPPCHHKRTDASFEHKDERAYADTIGCYWMSIREGRQAVPPVYTEYIGGLMMAHIEDARLSV